MPFLVMEIDSDFVGDGLLKSAMRRGRAMTAENAAIRQ
jgi:hypothetical protein